MAVSPGTSCQRRGEPGHVMLLLAAIQLFCPFPLNRVQILRTGWLPIASLAASFDCPRDTNRLAFRQKELSLLTNPQTGTVHRLRTFPSFGRGPCAGTSLHPNYRRANDRQSVEASKWPANSCRALPRDGTRARRDCPKFDNNIRLLLRAGREDHDFFRSGPLTSTYAASV